MNKYSIATPSASTSLTPQMKSSSLLRDNTTKIKVRTKGKKKRSNHTQDYSSHNYDQATINHKNPIGNTSSNSVASHPVTAIAPMDSLSAPQHRGPSKYWRGAKGGSQPNTTSSSNHNHNQQQNQQQNQNPYRNKKTNSGGVNTNNNHPQSYQYHHNNHHPHGKSHHGNKTFVNNAGNMVKSKPNNSNHHHRNNIHHNRFMSNGNSSTNKHINDDFKQPQNRERASPSWLRDEKTDTALTDELVSSLEAHGVFETTDGSKNRLKVLSSLQILITEWSNENFLSIPTYQQNQRQDKCTPTIKAPQLISFGSYRLGVHCPTADLDVLALCPSHSTRDKFFSTLIARLNRDSRVGGLHPIPGAYTPVIKFYMDGISIDLLFVGLVDDSKLVPTFDKNDLNSKYEHRVLSPLATRMQPQRFEFELDDSMLIGLDEPSVRSLNGVRVAQYLLTLVPNLTNFRFVLRTVKAWALVHGLYSNVLGFLGGINWAILVSYICMRNKNASSPQLLCIFFSTFSEWNWSKPVALVPIVHNPPSGVMPLQVWNPTINLRDRAHIMPIITPSYPSMNSSYNVGPSQLRRLRGEMARAAKSLIDIAKHNGTTITTSTSHSLEENRCCWDNLLKENDFFRSHVHYLHVTIRATNEAHFRSWFGFCESRLRILIAGLESPSMGVQAYPFAKFFDSEHGCSSGGGDVIGRNGENDGCSKETSFFIALRFSYGVESIDLKSCTEEFSYKVNSWVERKDSMDLTIEHVFQEQLPSYVLQRRQPIDKITIEAREEDDENLVTRIAQQQERLVKDAVAAVSSDSCGMQYSSILNRIDYGIENGSDVTLPEGLKRVRLLRSTKPLTPSENLTRSSIHSPAKRYRK